MKKLFCFFVVIMFIASCEGPMGPPGPPGPDGYPGDANWKVINIDIDKWELDPQGGYFFARVDVPELTNFIFTDGIVLAYHETVVNSNNSYKTPLPYTRYNIEVVPGEPDYLWSELIDFTFTPGQATFYSNSSNFITFEPDPIYLTLVLFW